MQQDRLIFIVFLLLLLFKQTSQSKYFQPYKQIIQAHPNDTVRFVKICSKQTFMVTSNDNQLKIWQYSTLVNLITSTYSSQILFVQLHPIDCRIFISLSNLTILVIDGNNFSQIVALNYPGLAASIVFIPQKRVFYLGGYNRNKIDKYNANTYSLMTSMDIPSAIFAMDGYYNYQLKAAILVVSLNIYQFKSYNMETSTQINLKAFFCDIIKFSKSGKFLFTYDDLNGCLYVYNLNQYKNYFQQFSKICNLYVSYQYSRQQILSIAYSDDFVIIGTSFTLNMVQSIFNKQFKVIDDYQLFKTLNSQIICMSQINKIIAVGTSNGNVILIKVNYPFNWWIVVIGGIIFFFIMVLIIVIICRWYKEQFPCFKSNKIQNEKQNKINQNLTIGKNSIKQKKEKKKTKHLIQVENTLNDSKLNLIQEEQESSKNIKLREKQLLKEYDHQTELKIQEDQTVQYNDQQLYEENRQSLYQQIQEQKRQNIQLSKKANKKRNKIKLQPIVPKKTSFKQKNKEEEILSDIQQQGHQKQLQKQEVKEQKSKKQDFDKFG